VLLKIWTKQEYHFEEGTEKPHYFGTPRSDNQAMNTRYCIACNWISSAGFKNPARTFGRSFIEVT